MFAISDSQTKSQLIELSDLGRMCRARKLCSASVAFVIVGFGAIRPARAQGRGAIGGELSAGLGYPPHVDTPTVRHDTIVRDGLSLWYRPILPLAFGMSIARSGTTNDLDNANFGQHALISHGFFYEAFVDGRLFPSSGVGAFGRVSGGVARLTLVPPVPNLGGWLPNEERTEAVLELEAGPELRLFLAPRRAEHRSDLFLRVRGTVTTMPAATFFGFGLALGFEG